MRRIAAVTGLLAVTLTSACAKPGTPQAPPAPVPPASSTSAAPTATATSPGSASSQPATPTPSATAAPAATASAAAPGQSDPAKFASLMLTPEDLPGWQRGDNGDVQANSPVDPPECKDVYDYGMGKTAGPMGETVGYMKGDEQSIQEFVDLVNKGTDSVAGLDQALGRCGQLTVDNDGEKTHIKVAKQTPTAPLGEGSLLVKYTVQMDSPIDFWVYWVGYKDTLLTMTYEGQHLDQKVLEDATTKAENRLKQGL